MRIGIICFQKVFTQFKNQKVGILHLSFQPPGARTGYRVVVENLSSSTSWQDLKDFMRQAGEVNYTNTHQSRSGEGVAEFGSRGDME